MSTTERREIHTTRQVVRTLSPPRTTSKQSLTEFDNNLDNLLEDLQSSVSRPSSSLGNTYKEMRTTSTVNSGKTKTDSLGRFTHLQAANPTTIISDDSYNYKPENVRQVKMYKENYHTYNVNTDVLPEKNRMQNNINKLDTLLDDLQQARQGTLDRNRDTGIDSGLLDSNHQVSKRTVHRELVYDTDSTVRSGRENSVGREMQYINDGTYGDIRPIRQQSPSPNRLKAAKISYNYESDTKDILVPASVVETTEPAINPNILAHLDPNLLPSPNTKVTTTIKTYTYEIPGSGYPSTVSPTSTLSPVSPKLSETVYSTNPNTPSQSFAYSKVENKTVSSKNLSNYPSDYIRPVSPDPVGFKKNYVETVTTRTDENYGKPKIIPGKDVYIYNETTTTRNLDYPNSRRSQSPSRAPKSPIPTPKSPISGKQVHIYNETTTTRNVQGYPNDGYPKDGYPKDGYPKDGYPKDGYPKDGYPRDGYPKDGYPRDGYPRDIPDRPANHTYIINETHTTRNIGGYPKNGYPNHPQGHPDPTTTVIYKHDTHTTNNFGGPYTETFDPKNPPKHISGKPNTPNDPRDPNLNITYKYNVHHTSTNHYKGYPNDENEPLLAPKPFPVDSNDTNSPNGPPKRLDELMANIGKEPPTNAYNAGYTLRQAEKEHELSQKKEVANLTENKKQDIKDLPKSKNVAGPPVYYPPGHEMFLQKEESGGYRAEGGMMKESGKYKYESKSSSKTKSSGGVAVVPVCLPLCCGLPCVIM